jgi:hypothetical protein
MMLLQTKHFREAVRECNQSAVYVRVRVDEVPIVDQELCIGTGVLVYHTKYKAVKQNKFFLHIYS